jgi:ATP-binding cassette subfamily F protein 3
MSLLNVSGLAFRYSSTTELFRDVTFAIKPGDRLAVVGANGAGKSTLLALLAGDLEPSEGTIARRQRLSAASAAGFVHSSDLLFDSVFASRADVSALRRQIRALEAELADEGRAAEYSDALEDYLAQGGYAAEAECERVLSGLGFHAGEFELTLNKLSGGQRTRASLARALNSHADLLLLDEPTNHLDIAARQWLEDQLSASRGACVFVSHDRAFLERVATSVLEIRRGTATLFEGGYFEYRARRSLLDRQAWEEFDGAERRKSAMERAAERRAQLAARVAIAPVGVRHSKDFYGRKAAKVARTGRLLRERSSHAPEVKKPWEDQPIPRLDFGNVERSGEIALRVDGVTKAFDGRTLFEDVTFHLARGERLALVGPNGSGKTTLLRILLGKEHPDSGEVRLGANVEAACFTQGSADVDPAKTPLELCGSGTQARTLLGCLKVRPDRVARPFRELSAGERTKVVLVQLLLSGANLLILDEPTDNLEIEAQEALEQALAQYPGTLIVVSHDRAFLSGVGASAKVLSLR